MGYMLNSRTVIMVMAVALRPSVSRAFIGNQAVRRAERPSYFPQQPKVSFLSSLSITNSSFSFSSTTLFENHPDVHNKKHVEYDPLRPFFPVYYNDVYEVILPPNHRFPMEKYRQVRQRFQQLVKEDEQNTEKDNHVLCDFRVSPLATSDEITTTHSPEYLERFLTGDQTEVEIRNVGFPWSESGVKRALSSAGGTVAAACDVCETLLRARETVDQPPPPIWGAHVAGGTHHAFYDYGEGFCVFSDIAVAANVVRQRYPEIRRILIIDLDVHQGNGNAVLFEGRDDVVTFSIQCEANYFSKKEKSDLDIELPVGCDDGTYLSTLHHWLTQIDQIGGKFDLVFYQAGVDVLGVDRLGRMSLTSTGVQKRNELVFKFCQRNSLPVVITMGGGYPKRGESWDPIIEAHANVYFQAYQFLGGM